MEFCKAATGMQQKIALPAITHISQVPSCAYSISDDLLEQIAIPAWTLSGLLINISLF